MIQRYHALDSLRAVMMLLGIVIHAAISYVTTVKGWGYQDAQTHPLFDFLVNFIHIFRMPIFFVMAGFFAALLFYKRGIRELLVNRFNRITIPFGIFWCILFPIVTGFIFANITDGQAFWEEIVSKWASITLGDLKTMHLWFLYYLMMMYVLTGILVAIPVPVFQYLKAVCSFYFLKIMQSPYRVGILSIMTLISLYPMRLGTLDTSTTPIPALKILFAYLIFYFFGWLLFEQRQLIETFTRRIWQQLGLATLLLPINLWATHQFIYDDFSRNTFYHWLTMMSGAVVTWLMIFSITGLFLKYLNRFSPLGRYISDASYWVYLIHMPIVVWLAGFLKSFEISAIAKFMIICVLTHFLCFFTYHHWVRASFIGKLLNGRKYDKSLPEKHPKPPFQPLDSSLSSTATHNSIH